MLADYLSQLDTFVIDEEIGSLEVAPNIVASVTGT